MAQATLTETQQRPIRAAVFATVEEAREAVNRLRAAGFTTEQVTVVTSDAAKAREFQEYEHEEPAGAYAPAAVATGGAIGATLGAFAAGAVGVATGGVPLIVAGGLGLMAGAVWGGFIGAMMTRGIEKEAANFYDQEVQRGSLLVAVEEHHPDHHPSLADAEKILADAGAAPLPLCEG